MRCASTLALVAAACGGHPTPKHISPRPGWTGRMQLQIDLGAAELFDFPVPVRLTADRLAPASYAVDGHDLRFTDESGVDLAYDIETISRQAGALIWVRVPRISGPTKLTLYYGSPDALVLDPNEAHSVWKRGFVHVLHCVDETNDVSPHQNATAATNTMPADGVFGPARYFATRQVDAVTSQLVPMTGDRTLCAWVKPDSIEGQTRIVGAKGFAIDREGSALRCGGALTQNVLAVNAWRDVCCVHRAGVDTLVVDGAPIGKPGRSTAGPDRTFELGGTHGDAAAKRFVGTIDEVRISDVARGLPWLVAESHTRAEIVTFGPPEKI
ncbi:MAG TPA: DUF2341 domain-containing protein [Kofleriaceae bacterium]